MAKASSANNRLRSIGILALLSCIFAIVGSNPVNLRPQYDINILDNAALPGLGQDAMLGDETLVALRSTPEDTTPLTAKPNEPPPASTPAAAANPVPSAAASPGGPVPPSGYAPTKGTCSSMPNLVRSTANAPQSLSSKERDYIQGRQAKASRALQQWLQSVGRNKGEQFQVASMPTLALTISGGGLRSMLVGAGVVQALDSSDSNTSVSGLYQAISYQAGLSGGAWLLSSIIGNDFSSISGVAKDPWATTLLENNSLIMTENIKNAPELKTLLINDMTAKAKAGFPPTPADVWGRASGYVTLRSRGGGAYRRLSDVRDAQKFRDHDVPYPIITALGMEDITGKICDVVATDGDYATQYEFSPYEFGSWQKGVEGFIPTELLGTAGVDGKPRDNVCVKNFDNLGFVIGVSSVRFNEDCGRAGVSLLLLPALNEILQPEFRADATKSTEAARRQLYAPVPNPFKSYAASPKVNKLDELYLFDGGQSNQNNPIWPLIQPARQVDVILVNDNSADTDEESIGADKEPLYNWPNGTEIRHTYLMAKQFGLTKMPFIPDVATWTRQGLDKRASVFGCHNKNVTTIVFLPNAPYKAAMQGNQYTAKTDYNATEQAAMISYGQLVATQDHADDWALSLACIITHKHVPGGKVSAACTERLKKYCYTD